MKRIDIELSGDYYGSYLKDIQKKLNNKYSLHGAHHRNLNTFIQAQVLQLHDQAMVLDAGCGLSIWLTSNIESKIRYTGVDCQSEAIAFCESVYSHRDYRLADLYDLPFNDGTFDMVVMREVIEHLRMPDKAVNEICRVLKPQGIFLLTTPNYGNPLLYVIEHTYNRFFGGPCKPYLPDVHPSKFNRGSLHRLLKDRFLSVELGSVNMRINLTAIAKNPIK